MEDAAVRAKDLEIKICFPDLEIKICFPDISPQHLLSLISKLRFPFDYETILNDD